MNPPKLRIEFKCPKCGTTPRGCTKKDRVNCNEQREGSCVGFICECDEDGPEHGTSFSDVCRAAVCCKMFARQEDWTPTKERVGLKAALDRAADKPAPDPTRVWWDIEHHWMVVLGKEGAEAVRYALGKHRDKLATAPLEEKRKGKKTHAPKARSVG